MTTFTVPGNPIPWERNAGHGRRRFTAPRTRLFQAKVKAHARRAGVKPLAGPVELLVVAYRENRRRADWDNIGKTVSDALNGIAFEDDVQVEDGRVLKRVDPENPRTEVTVRSIP